MSDNQRCRSLLALATATLLCLSLSSCKAPPAAKKRDHDPFESSAGVTRQGSARRDIGPLPSCTGSVTQSQAILDLMKEEPGMNDYTVYYKTEADRVSFKVNLAAGTIRRTHIWANGYRMTEEWKGFVMERLQVATGGTALDQTPEGKIQATLDTGWEGRSQPPGRVDRNQSQGK